MKNCFYIVSLLVLSLLFKLSAQTNNFDFELTAPGVYTTANAVAGWTVTNRNADSQCTPTLWLSGSPEFSVLSTPIQNFPGAGIICHSPLGGTTVVRLNNSSIGNYSSTKISRTIAVTVSNSLFTFAFAGYWQGLTHACCDAAYFKVLVRDCSGALLSCPSLSLHAGSGCGNPTANYTVDAVSNTWTNWQMRAIDLTPYIGTCVTIEAITTDCALGGHYGTTLFDAQCGSHFTPNWNTSTNVSTGNAVSFCSGSNQAVLQAPLGYTTYSWIPHASHPTLSASQATQATLSTSNAIPGSTFTVNLANANGCVFIHTVAVAYTNVGIVGLGSSASCSLGSSGSATVFGTGSATNYNYTWLNSSNSVVATTSIVTNLAPGIYSVSVNSAGSQSATCGTAVSTVTIGITPPSLKDVIKPFCGNEAYFSYPGGSNYQWYNSLSAISATAGGTSPTYTATSPALNGSIYYLRYVSSQGCADSLKFTLSLATTSGSVNVSHNPLACQGASNGSVVLTILPSTCLSCGQNAFSVFSTGTSTPVYSASVNSTSSNTHTFNNLSAGGTYSVNAFDGSCKYGTSFSITPYVFNYNLSPSNSPTLCPGNVIAANITFSVPPSQSQYSYSWSPTTFLAGGVGSLPNTLILPNTAPGSITNLIYTIVVTPSAINCPLTKTLSITIANPLSPTISPLPTFCTNSSSFVITANPPGGTYSPNNNILSVNGVLSPSLAAIGVNTITYANSVGTCVATSSSSFVVNAVPNISVSGNLSICEGQSTTLLANGASTYTWNNSVIHPFILVSPNLTSVYTVTGSDAVTNCTNSKSITVSVLPNPALTILGDSLLCLGETRTLFASGANTYSWSNGSLSQSISVSPNISTTYTLQGVSLQGNCSSTKLITLSVLPCTDIHETLSRESGFSIYPNPANDHLFIETKFEVTLTLADELGKILLRKRAISGKQTIDIQNLENGIYIMILQSTKETKTLKLVKTD